MKKIAGLLQLVTLLAAQSVAEAAGRSIDLDAWAMTKLTPYLAETLATHPRFRNEAVRFVVMHEGNPQASPSALALALRNQVRDALVDTPGIRIAWLPDRADINRSTSKQRIDCTADAVHYYVGIEISEGRSGNFHVRVRALDLEERSWVAGFGMAWRGMLTAMQHRAWLEYETDTSFRGDREAPYAKSQTDLLAAHLAHDLGCALLRQVSGEYRVGALPGDETAGSDGIVELVSNNLAFYRALQLAGEADEANAYVEGKAHRIDDDLYQYWVTVKPNDESTDLPALSASAYIYLPDEFVTPAVVETQVADGVDADSEIFESVELVSLQRSPYGFVLQTRTSRDAVLFYLNHRQGHGLVRLAGPGCARGATARVSRAGERLRFELPLDSLSKPRWQPASYWEQEPKDDSYYVVAATDSKAGRAIARHVERLPARCGKSMRPGLDGQRLTTWLTQFADLQKWWAHAVDWQVISVQNVY